MLWNISFIHAESGNDKTHMELAWKSFENRDSRLFFPRA